MDVLPDEDGLFDLIINTCIEVFPEIHFSRRDAHRELAEVAFLPVIITVNDYRKGQRPPQFLINDRTAVKSFFCDIDSADQILNVFYLHICDKSRGDALEDGKGEAVAGVFAISIYSDYCRRTIVGR